MKNAYEDDQSESEQNNSGRKAVSTLDWFLFENKMRGIIKDIISPLFVKDQFTSETIEDINILNQNMKQRIEDLEKDSSDFYGQLKRADLLFVRVDEIERKITKHYEEYKYDLSAIKENQNLETQKQNKMDQEIRLYDEKLNKIVGSVNHSRETFLDLKSQVYKEITAMRETFYSDHHKLADDQRIARQEQETILSQLENHRAILNDLDSVLEKINIDLTHKFNLTIKGLQEEKADKWDFNTKFAFVDKQITNFFEDIKIIKQQEEKRKKDLYKLIHANTQIEFFDLMNAVFKEESDEKENMRNYLKNKFANITKTKISNRTVTVKKKIHSNRSKTEESPSKEEQKNEGDQNNIIIIENLDIIDEKSEGKSYESDQSEYVEELAQEEYEKELDLAEITDQVLNKFNEIKEITFSPAPEKSK